MLNRMNDLKCHRSAPTAIQFFRKTMLSGFHFNAHLGFIDGQYNRARGFFVACFAVLCLGERLVGHCCKEDTESI